jgi:hypothetical protein
MTNARDYPSRLMTAHCEPLHASLQPGVVRVEEPVAAFPRSGYCKDATYYAVNRCEGNLVNRPRQVLGEWLQHSYQSVDIRAVQLTMERLKVHEPHTYEAAAALLRTGTPSSLLMRDDHTVNPAILCLVHASDLSCQYLPVTPCVPTRVCSPPGAQCCDAGAEAVGEVWWLFDQGRPYLAEVFNKGEVPASRLPHLDRSSIKGRHVARLLGRQQTIKLLPHSARMCLFTPWCALYKYDL